MEPETIIAIGLVITLSHTVGAMIGFASTMLAMPLVLILMGNFVETKALLTFTAFLNSFFIVLIDRNHISWKEVGLILLLAVPMLPLGNYLFQNLPEKPMKTGLGIFIIIVAMWQAYRNWQQRQQFEQPQENSPTHEKITGHSGIIYKLYVVVGGLIHGAFVVGGPFLTLYASKAIEDKRVFRGSLSTVWLLLNGVMLVVLVASGGFTGAQPALYAVSIPCLLLSVYVGHKCHKKFSPGLFKNLVYAALGVGGVAMIFFKGE